MKAIISEKGQITIPKLLRERLGLHAGQILEFHEEKGKLIATKSSSSDPVDAVFGILKTTRKTNQIMNVLRGEPDPR
ncbi:MAG: AbrB/MazE/SpoVT family DNA-binding domain-containing protein [Nitrospirota bacterium]|nr:AbrB/MazE/SpoVT family DNA-binding domain-containing protein [Nitrospirota bacterium]